MIVNNVTSDSSILKAVPALIPRLRWDYNNAASLRERDAGNFQNAFLPGKYSAGNFSILLAGVRSEITASYSSPPRDERVILSYSFFGDVTFFSNAKTSVDEWRWLSRRDHRHRLPAVLEETLHTLLSAASSRTHLRVPSITSNPSSASRDSSRNRETSPRSPYPLDN